VREADLDKHLAGDKAETKTEGPKPAAKPESAAPADPKNDKPIELGGTDDFQLKQALNHLKGLPVLAKMDKQDEPPAAAEKKN
jgi:carboxyl-terminal processing protease